MSTVEVPEEFQSLLVPIDDVFLADRNVRTNHDVDFVAACLVDFGWHAVIVANRDGEILIGNGRYKAARKLELEQVPVVHVNDKEEKAIRRMATDNRASELSDWDFNVLDTHREALLELDEVYHIEDILPEPAEDFETGDDDEEDVDLDVEYGADAATPVVKVELVTDEITWVSGGLRAEINKIKRSIVAASEPMLR